MAVVGLAFKGTLVMNTIYQGVINHFSITPITYASSRSSIESESITSSLEASELSSSLRAFYQTQGLDHRALPSVAELDKVCMVACELRDKLKNTDRDFFFRGRTNSSQPRLAWKVSAFRSELDQGIRVVFDAGKPNRIGSGGYKQVNAVIMYDFDRKQFEKLAAVRSTVTSKEAELSLQTEIEVAEYFEALRTPRSNIFFGHSYVGRKRIVAKNSHGVSMRKKISVDRYQSFCRLGQCLRSAVNNSVLNSLEQKKKAIQCMLEEVDKLHKIGYAHRDIKLDNFLLHKANDDSFEIQLIDFGVAAKDRRMRICGTIRYLPPEVLINYSGGVTTSYRHLPAAIKGDIYSLGLTIYNLLDQGVNRLPIQSRLRVVEEYGSGFDGLASYSVEEIAKDHTNSLKVIYSRIEREANPEMKKLFELVARMLTLDPDERPSLADLISYIHDLDTLEIRTLDFPEEPSFFSENCVIC